MNFTPKSESELNDNILLPDGQYKARVYDSKDTDELGNGLVTTKGIDKINLICEVFNHDGKSTKVMTVLTTAYMKLLKHFCDVSGLIEKYNSGSLNANDCRNAPKDFIVDISTRSYISNKNGQEIYVNQINDFLPIENKSQVEEFIDSELSDIPF